MPKTSYFVKDSWLIRVQSKTDYQTLEVLAESEEGASLEHILIPYEVLTIRYEKGARPRFDVYRQDSQIIKAEFFVAPGYPLLKGRPAQTKG